MHTPPPKGCTGQGVKEPRDEELPCTYKPQLSSFCASLTLMTSYSIELLLICNTVWGESGLQHAILIKKMVTKKIILDHSSQIKMIGPYSQLLYTGIDSTEINRAMTVYNSRGSGLQTVVRMIISHA